MSNRARFVDRVVIVTGGANGIGRASAQSFAREGARVVIADIDRDAGADTCARIEAAGGTARLIETDVADERAVAAMVEGTVGAFAGVDVLVNGAAQFIMRGLDASVADWRRIMDVNVIGYALCARAVAPHMRERGRGAIVNIASVSSFIAQPGYLTYNTSKAAVVNMTRCMAMELAPDRIRVNAVCPGTVWTDRTERYISETMGLDREAADRHPDIGGVHLLRRTADVIEIAAAILFLASDEASFITAENLAVDGGFLAH